jgi:hypothetical protein
MYLYGFYKTYGSDVLDRYQESGSSISTLEQEQSRTLEGLLLWDFARADIQAYVLHHTFSSDWSHSYTYRLGETYIGAIAMLVPDSIWADRPATKLPAATDLLYGADTFLSGGQRSSRIFGLAGEAILNFGVGAVPFSFLVLGGLVGTIRRAASRWVSWDSRWLLFPLLVNFCFMVLTADSDIIVFFLIKNGLLPFALILFSSRRVFSTWASDAALP